MKKLLLLLLCVLLISTTAVYAQLPSIMATATVSPDRYVVIQGSVTAPTGEYVSLMLGDEKAFLYIGQTCIENGQFCFEFKLDDKAPSGEHRYKLSASNVIFVGTIFVTEAQNCKRNFINGDLELSMENFEPRISGIINCSLGSKINLRIEHNGSTISSQTITAKDGGAELNVSLPRLRAGNNFKVICSAINGDEVVLTANVDVQVSAITVLFDGDILAETGYKLVVDITNDNINLLNKKITIKDELMHKTLETVNIISKCNFKIGIDITENSEKAFDGCIYYRFNPELYNALKSKYPHFDTEEKGIITPNELAAIKGVLNLSGCNISSINGLQSCTGITHLYLNNNAITDMSPILVLDNLLYLNLDSNLIKDVYRLPPNLRYLSLSGNKLRSLDNFGFTNSIVHLNLSNNQIKNIYQLNGYKLLQYLDLRNNAISNTNDLPAKKYVKILK